MAAVRSRRPGTGERRSGGEGGEHGPAGIDAVGPWEASVVPVPRSSGPARRTQRGCRARDTGGLRAPWGARSEGALWRTQPRSPAAPQPRSPAAPQPRSPAAPQPRSPAAPQPRSPAAPQPRSPSPDPPRPHPTPTAPSAAVPTPISATPTLLLGYSPTLSLCSPPYSRPVVEVTFLRSAAPEGGEPTGRATPLHAVSGQLSEGL
nr:proline-rich protein 2-like isoform X2 [Pongo pygmaeus]